MQEPPHSRGFFFAEPSKKQARRAQLIGKRLVCENVPRVQAQSARHDWQALTAADLSKKQAQRAQLIGRQVVCENVPQIKPTGRRCAVDVDRSDLSKKQAPKVSAFPASRVMARYAEVCYTLCVAAPIHGNGKGGADVIDCLSALYHGWRNCQLHQQMAR